MSLPEPVARTQRHHRRIDLNGYEREDGLWDIEAHLVDARSYEFSNKFRGKVPVGTPVHEMWMRLTIDDTLTIRDVAAHTSHAPFPSCPDIADNYKQLIGMRIGSGWTDRVRSKMGQVGGCTHLYELLRPLATTAIQTIMPLRRPKKPDPAKRPQLLNSCHGWRADGEGVRELYPNWYQPAQE